MIDKAREVALKVLYKIDEKGAYSNIALNEGLKENSKILNSQDIGLISEIVYGVTTWKLTLDEIIKKYSKIRLKKLSIWILNILRMSIYQIVFLDKIPKSASVNEGVNLAKRYGHKSSAGFVNAILRKVEKEDYNILINDLIEIKEDIKKENFEKENIEKENIEKKNIKKENKLRKFDKEKSKINNEIINKYLKTLKKVYSMPLWLLENLKEDGLELEKIEEICKYSNIRPKLSVRVNKLKISKEDLKKKLEENKINCEDGILKDFLNLKNVRNIENLEEFKSGLFTVEDEVAGLTSYILNPKENEKILDACSSPGGKTTYLAELSKDKAEIEAWDIHAHRVKLVENARDRLGIKNIKVKVQDACEILKDKEESFDKILLDVPCLGLGVLKRKPDIKWQKENENSKEITKIQYKILETCSKYLKKEGELIYSTCSILQEENSKIVNKFLKENPEFKIEQISFENDNENLNKFFEKYLTKEGFLQVYQNEKTDGFFIAKLRKCK